MTYLFSRPTHDLLETFAWSNVLLAFDYDGTLAPIAARPEDAHMRPDTQALLTSVARAYPTVVISGRPALRMGDMSGCGAPIIMGAPNVMIGG